MKGLAGEFKSFVLRGNVVDLAVGIVIGIAFAAVVTSLVEDVLTPLVGLWGSPDFGGLSVTIGEATLHYGKFLNALIAFLTISLTVFLFAVKPVNALMAKRNAAASEAEPSTRSCPLCLSEIPLAAKRCAHCAADLEPSTSRVHLGQPVESL